MRRAWRGRKPGSRTTSVSNCSYCALMPLPLPQSMPILLNLLLLRMFLMRTLAPLRVSYPPACLAFFAFRALPDTDKWERASDLVLLETAEEDRPKAKTQEMLRDMMDSSRHPANDGIQRGEGGGAGGVDSRGAPGSTDAAWTDDAASSSALSDEGSVSGQYGNVTERGGEPPTVGEAAEDEMASSTTTAISAPRPSLAGGSCRADDPIAVHLTVATARKQEGNGFYQAGRDENALECYDGALRLLGGVALPAARSVAAMDATTEATTGATTTEATTSSAAAEAGALPALGEAEKARLRTAALPLLTSLHCNRSAVLLRLGRTHEARRAAADAVVLSPGDVKARRRRAAALIAMGEHRLACDDLLAAWRRTPKSCDTSRALADAWRARAPPLAPLFDAAIKDEPLAAYIAFAAALGGGGKAREWTQRYGSGDGGGGGGGANALSRKETACLIDAARHCAGAADDPAGAAALLRVCSFIMAVRTEPERGPGPFSRISMAEDGLIDGFGRAIAELCESNDEAVIVAALELVQAVAMRRVANCVWMPEATILRLYTQGRTGSIRAAAEGCLVWLSRHPGTRNWMQGMERVRLEPLLLVRLDAVPMIE